MDKLVFNVTLGASAEKEGDSSSKPEDGAVSGAEPLTKKKLPAVPIKHVSIVERTRSKSANRHLTAGATKFHGPASIYRNDRPNEIRSLSGTLWECIISGEDHILAQVLVNKNFLCGQSIDLCAMQDKQGVLRSWGRGEGGQLGHGRFAHSGTPTAIETLQDCSVSDISCGAEFSAALTEDGQLFTWGLNDHGQLGHGNTSKVCIPTPVAAMFRLSSRHVAMMACGYAHMIVLTTARDVYTWGNNRFGQLGLGAAHEICPTPQRVRIMSGLEIKQFGAGENHTCVLTSTGDIYTWGRGDYGQLGHGDQQNKDAPTLLKAFDQRSQPRKMSVGADFIFVLTYSGAVYSWGRNTFGQLGHGWPMLHDSKYTKQPADEPSPRLVSYFSGDNDEIEEGDITLSNIACGTHHVMALSANRTVLYAWGRGEHGQLGLDLRDSTRRSLALPKIVPRLKGFTILQITCGLNHTIITAETVDKRPTILSWGRGSYGQLGHGTGKPVPPAYFKSQTAPRPQSAMDILDSSHNSGPTGRSASGELRRALSFSSDASLNSVTASPVRKASTAVSSNVERSSTVRKLLDPVFTGEQQFNAADESSNFAASVLKEYMSRPPYRKHDLDPEPVSTEMLLQLLKVDRDVALRLPPRPASTLGFEREQGITNAPSQGDSNHGMEFKGHERSSSSMAKQPSAVKLATKSKRANSQAMPELPRRPNTALR